MNNLAVVFSFGGEILTLKNKKGIIVLQIPFLIIF
jgi:hypothetical protein